MTEYTPNVAIPYPSTTDSACTVASEMLAAAGVIDAAMLAVEAAIDVKINPQVFRVSLTDGSTVLNANYVSSFGATGDEGRIPFDTVDFDPEGVVDLVRDNRAVLLDRGVIAMGVSGGINGMPAWAYHRLDTRDGYEAIHGFTPTNGLTQPAHANTETIILDSSSSGAPVYARYLCSAAGTSGTSVSMTMWGLRLSGNEAV